MARQKPASVASRNFAQDSWSADKKLHPQSISFHLPLKSHEYWCPLCSICYCWQSQTKNEIIDWGSELGVGWFLWQLLPIHKFEEQNYFLRFFFDWSQYNHNHRGKHHCTNCFPQICRLRKFPFLQNISPPYQISCHMDIQLHLQHIHVFNEFLSGVVTKSKILSRTMMFLWRCSVRDSIGH